MIGRIHGVVLEVHGSVALVDVGGVGYEIHCTARTASHLLPGEEATLVIFTDMRESSIFLFGFLTLLERRIFTFLTEVKGVGPKMALELLSLFRAEEILQAIGVGDVPRIQRAKGVGKKTAERIVLELKDKVAEYVIELGAGTTGFSSQSGQVRLHDQVQVTHSSNEQEDAILALVSLGFPRSEAERVIGVVRKSHPAIGEPGEIVKQALQYL